MILKRILTLLLLVAAADCAATPFWGAKHSSAADTPLADLKPGQFIWEGQLEPNGPIMVVVSVPEQMACVYRNGVRIGVSTVSSGKKGHGTPRRCQTGAGGVSHRCATGGFDLKTAWCAPSGAG